MGASEATKVVDMPRGEAPDVVVARERLKAFKAETGWSHKRIADGVGYSKATITGFLNGNYNGDYAAVAGDVVAFLDGQQAPEPDPQASDRVPATARFVETATAQQVMAAVEYARQMEDMAIIYGDPGTGKTAALERYRDEHAGDVVMMTAAPHLRTPMAVLCELARACGIPVPEHGVRVRTVWGDLVRSLQRRPVVVIVDEAQHLPLDALEELRSIHDATHVPLILAGNHVVYHRLRGTGQHGFAQLFSRVALRWKAEGSFTQEEVAAVVGDGVAPDAMSLLHRWANGPGALRTVSKALRLARLFLEDDDLARQCGGKVTRSLLRQVERKFLITGA